MWGGGKCGVCACGVCVLSVYDFEPFSDPTDITGPRSTFALHRPRLEFQAENSLPPNFEGRAP